MKQIELTLKHREKLLEMCKELFPSSDFDMYDLVNVGESKLYPEIWIIQDNSQIFAPYIHWFEFCMTHLQRKILGVLDYEKTKIFLMRCLFQCEQPHPIDYLYSEFLKLKNGK
jgi:hypothetical protein